MLGRRGGGLAVEVLRVVLGRRSLARRVGAAKWVGGGGVSGQDGGGSRFVCRVGAARRVGSGGVLGQGRMKAAHVHEWPATSRVLRAVLGRRGGLAVAVCWRWRRVASHVGAACWGGTNGGSSRARGGGNGLLHSG
ncbi:hypothetical protein EDB86DRAFT_2836004 [Lactarius hatsudake]|nr:hypothetical protein EDB86DRAFT_2836004 [Lactarius hatsudake]